MKTSNTTNETKDVIPEVPVTSVPEYDGIEMFKADYETKPLKVNMNSNEVKAWFGDNDPKLYFREGKIPNYFKSLGDLLAEDREEVLTLRKTLPQYSKVLLFKHHLQNLYTLVVPKLYGEFELDANGEITDANVKVHTVAFAFQKAFEKGEFIKKLEKTGLHFKSNESRNRRD